MENGLLFVNDEFLKKIEEIIETKLKKEIENNVYQALEKFHSNKLLMSKKEVCEKLGISKYKLEKLIESELLQTTPDGKKIYSKSFWEYVNRNNE